MSGGIPAMNMDEWQRHMREEKQKEREKKNESANMLKTYKGGVTEEEMKLSALKKEDQQKKKESAQLLQSYKGGVKDEDTKLTALKKEDMAKRKEAAQSLQGYKGTDHIEIKEKAHVEKPDYSNMPTPVKAPQGWDPSKEIQEGTVSALASGLKGKEAPVPTSDSEIRQVTEGAAAIQIDEKEPVTDIDESPVESENDKNLVFESAVNQEVAEDKKEEQMEQAEQIPEPVKEEEDAANQAINEEPVIVESSEVPLPTEIMFSFGIITKAEEPAVGGYTHAAQTIISSALKDSSDAVSYEPSYAIEIKDCKRDEAWSDPLGRNEVKRFLVVASATVLRSKDVTEAKANELVIGGLAEAMKTGAFVKMAKSINKE